jgi:hypothetical protein
VAAAGGWKSPRTVEEIYEQGDAASVYRVVTEPTHELREAQ